MSSQTITLSNGQQVQVTQQSDGKWYIQGDPQGYASPGAAQYYGATDLSYVSQGIDPTKPINEQEYFTKDYLDQISTYHSPIKEGSAEAWTFYGLDPKTGTISKEKLEKLKTGYLPEQLINLPPQTGKKDSSRHQYTDEEARELGINRVFGGKDYRIQRKAERKAKNRQARIEAGPAKPYAVLGLSTRENPYAYDNPNFPRLPEEVAAREAVQQQNTLMEVGYGGQKNYTPTGQKILQERRARREATALKMAYQKEFGNINPQISEAAYKPLHDYGTTYIPGKEQEDPNRIQARGIVQKAKQEGAESIQIYNKEGQPVGGIGLQGAEDVLTGLLNSSSGFSVRYASPTEKYVRPKEDKEFNTYISSLNKKGAIIDIYNKEGQKVGETSGQRSRYDILKASQQYGEVTVKPRYTNETLTKSYFNVPEQTIAVTKIGGQTFAVPGVIASIGQAGLDVLKQTGAAFLSEGYIKGADLGSQKYVEPYRQKLESPTLTQTVLSGQPNQKPLSYNIASGLFEAGLIIGPAKKIPGIKFEKVEVPGIEAKARTMSVGFGTRTKTVLSIAERRPRFGSPVFKKEIIIKQAESRTPKRGIKLAADSNQAEQRTFTNLENIKQFKGVTPQTVERARNVNRIIELGSQSKDVVRTPSFGEKPYESITKEETPSLLTSFKKQQKQFRGRLGPIEGSTSQKPYVLPEYDRPSGDFDFHSSNFKEAEKHAIKTASEIKPSEGRKFGESISYEQKSAKVYVREKGNEEKVGEFLNPEETDEEGISQAIQGETIFARGIPEKTEKIQGLKTYGLQRQFVKKGESIFSLQQTASGELKLEPFEPRKAKDIVDFYGIGKTKAENLRQEGKYGTALELEKELEIFKKNYSEVNIGEFLKRKQPAETTTLRTEPSLSDSLISSPQGERLSGAVTPSKLSNTKNEEPSLSKSKTSKPSITHTSYTSLPIKNSISTSRGLSRSRGSPSYSRSTASLSYSRYGSTLSQTSRPSLAQSRPSIGSKSNSHSLTSNTSKSLGSSSPSKSIGQSLTSKLTSSTLTSKSQTISPSSKSVTSRSTGSPRSIISSPISTPPTTQSREVPTIPTGQLGNQILNRHKPKPPKHRRPFIGAVPITEIEGVYKREDIIYGQKRVNKLSRKDILRSKKGYFSTSNKHPTKKGSKYFTQDKSKLKPQKLRKFRL